MPQLNPNPWFLILLMSWFMYLMLMPKTKKLKTLNEFLLEGDEPQPNPWNWPWI